MAEECTYYCFKSGDYHCNKTGKDITDSSFVKRYCWNYGYSDCPFYKESDSSSSSCYLTTACVLSKGLPDDCYELTTLRHFRDTYLNGTPEGRRDIACYYEIAPGLVKKLDTLPESEEIYQKIYDELVLPCIALIEAEKLAETHQLYREYTEALYQKYGVLEQETA